MKVLKLIFKNALRHKLRTGLTILGITIAVIAFGLLRTVVTDPILLVADEPTGDLDKNSAAEILTLLERLNKEFNKTILMVTHDPHAAERAKIVRHLEKGDLVGA